MKIFNNPQIFQTIFLMSVINIGILFFGLHLDYVKFFLIFLSTTLLDVLFGWIRFGKPRFPFSGVNAGFGISFFLRTDILIIYFLAAFVAIASKYFLQFKGRHFFNPSNLGAFSMLVLFPNITWTNPLQWAKTQPDTMKILFIYCFIIILGLCVVWIVNRTIKRNLFWIVIPFLIVHMVLFFAIAPNETAASMLKWYTPSFFVFVFFMLTDPMIPPENNLAKMGFGMSIAILPYILQFFINENYTHLASLFLMTLTLPLGRYIETKKHKIASEKNLYFCIFFALVIILGYCITQFGFVDLVFDNRCRQLFCS